MLNPLRLGIAGGILWALGMALTTLLSLWFGYGTFFLGTMASIYPGYEISIPGVVVGALYGFIDAFVGLYILGWIYNRLGGHS